MERKIEFKGEAVSKFFSEIGRKVNQKLNKCHISPSHLLHLRSSEIITGDYFCVVADTQPTFLYCCRHTTIILNGYFS